MSSPDHTVTQQEFDSFVQQMMIEGDLPAALHAIQDSLAPGHSGFQVARGAWCGLRHLEGDVYTSVEVANQVMSLTASTLKEYTRSRSTAVTLTRRIAVLLLALTMSACVREERADVHEGRTGNPIPRRNRKSRY